MLQTIITNKNKTFFLLYSCYPLKKYKQEHFFFEILIFEHKLDAACYFLFNMKILDLSYLNYYLLVRSIFSDLD